MTGSRNRTLEVGVPLGALVLGLTLTGCQASSGAATAPASPAKSPASKSSSGTSTAAGAQVTMSVADGAQDVAPDAPLTVKVATGQLDSVTLTPDGGKPIEGVLEGTAWALGRTLAPKTSYKLTAVATGEDGTTTSVTHAFRTISPRVEATYRVIPDGETVGVGMPVQVLFDSAVKTPEQRAAVERSIKLTITPAQTGSWGWSSPTQLYWRPKTFWKPGTKVTVNAPLSGVQTGEGKYVGSDKRASFTVGSARISKVDLKTHRLTVAENGKLVANYPISGGRPTAQYATRSGVKVITEKHTHLVMDAATLGVKEDDPNYYKLDVNYAMRVTNTGEFLHAAPWTVWAQGNSNVSHGCINMGPRDAKAMFNASKVGDPVVFVGSKRQFKPGEGMDVWVYTWTEWQARSAVRQLAGKSA